VALDVVALAVGAGAHGATGGAGRALDADT